MDLDTAILDGTVVTASDTFKADVGIRGDRIVAMAKDLGASARDVIDATGKPVLPGGIGSHIRISQPSGDGIVMADDFENSTRSALFVGNTLQPATPGPKGCNPHKGTIAVGPDADIAIWCAA